MFQCQMDHVVRCEEVRGVDGGSNIPAGRSGHRIVCIAGDIYVLGGYIQLPTGLEVVGEVWAYNILAGRWRQLAIPNCPFQLALSASALAVGKRIIIHGGSGIPFGANVNNSLMEIDVVTERCAEYACNPKDGETKNIPQKTYGHSLTYAHLTGHKPPGCGDMLFKVGGALGVPYTNIVSAFSFDTGTWETLFGCDGANSEEKFAPRYRHDAIFWKDELYIIGGTNSEGSLPFWPMPVFHVRERSWRNITFSGSCPAPLRCPCSVHFNHVVYTTGGISDATGALNDLVYAFDLESLVFYTVGTQPLPTFFHDLTVVSEVSALIPAPFGSRCLDLYAPTALGLGSRSLNASRSADEDFMFISCLKS
uniref:Kelch domain-containing protein 10 n=1 Tax=Mesocestoides corti TaxID=53468 RepID=A0A5K3F3L6_MESCO